MKKLFAFALPAMLIATGGCIFSSDDAAPPARTGWQPELWVTPDSVSAFFPNDWPDTTLFTWNRYISAGVPEYLMEAVVRLSTFRPLDAHFAFLRESDGSTPQNGTFVDMAMGAKGVWWVTDPVTGDRTFPGYGRMELHVLETGVLVRLTGWDAEIIDGFPPMEAQLWPVTFVRRGALFDWKSAAGSVHYRHDVGQLRARRVVGPLDDDDYVVMDLVLKNYLAMNWPTTVVLSKTVIVPNLRLPNGDNYFERDMDVLNPDHDTRAAFNVARLKELDTSALSQIGYSVVESSRLPAQDTLYLQVSAIGYNHARDEAVLYGTYYCGMLCAAGDIILLDKIHGYWRIKSWLNVWIS